MDQVFYDILDKISCHILLGRPWQYGCKVVHDSFKNVFTIEKGGSKHSLIPLQNEELGRRNLFFCSQVELRDSERVGDQHGKQICCAPKIVTKTKL